MRESSKVAIDMPEGNTVPEKNGWSGFWKLLSKLPLAARIALAALIILVAGAVYWHKFEPKKAESGTDNNNVNTNTNTNTNENNNDSKNTNENKTNITIVVNPNAPAQTDFKASAPAPNLPKPISKVTTKQTYLGGKKIETPDDHNENPQNLVADAATMEDAAATQYHYIDHPEKVPDKLIFAEGDFKLSYRYYSGSDKCVEIIRNEGDTEARRWVKHPLYRKHEKLTSSNPKRAHIDQPSSQDTQERKSSWLDTFVPTVFAQSVADDFHLREVQAQFCINPHPVVGGPFNYYWGAPIDTCRSPMYRRFADGCTHYQIYNRCSNFWEPAIYWTFCHPPPHS